MPLRAKKKQENLLRKLGVNKMEHKHYNLAYRAHVNSSFSPEKRAEAWCKGFDDDIAYLQELAIDQNKIEKYEKMCIDQLSAKSRCASSMITGPANFPVARMEKANRVERKRCDEMIEYYNKIVQQAKDEAFYKANPDKRPIRSDDEDALERLSKKLGALKQAQETMIKVNKIMRKQPIDRAALVILLGSEKAADEILKPDCFGGVGFASYSLANNRGRIKQVESRISEIENRKAIMPKDIMINGVRVLENTDAMRLQIFFDGKPAREMIALLKSHAFKWAPSNMAWQRQLTNNAICAFNNFVLPAIKG